MALDYNCPWALPALPTHTESWRRIFHICKVATRKPYKERLTTPLESFSRKFRFNLDSDLLAGLLEDGEVIHHSEEVGLCGLDLLGHVVQKVHAGLVGPDVTELREARDLHTSSVTSVATLQSRDIFSIKVRIYQKTSHI